MQLVCFPVPIGTPIEAAADRDGAVFDPDGFESDTVHGVDGGSTPFDGVVRHSR